MDTEKKNPRRTRTIVVLSIAAALAVSAATNIAWASLPSNNVDGFELTLEGVFGE